MRTSLIDEYPLMVLPTLVKLLGLEQAIVLQQIHFHLSTPKSGKEINGHKWIWNTYEQWQEDFPFWKERTIRKWICRLEKKGYLLSSQFDMTEWNARKYYRINYDFLDKSITELEQKQIRHDDAAPARSERAAQTETSTETTAKTTTETPSDLENSQTHSLRCLSTQPPVSDLNLSVDSPRNAYDSNPHPIPPTVRCEDIRENLGESQGTDTDSAQSSLFASESPVLDFSLKGAVSPALPKKTKPNPVSAQNSVIPGKARKRNQPESDSDPRAIHPAIVAVRDIRRQFPPKELWDEIIETIGDVPDFEKLRKCYAELLKRGSSKNAFYWCIDWYRDGIPELAYGKQKKQKEVSKYGIYSFSRK